MNGPDAITLLLPLAVVILSEPLGDARPEFGVLGPWPEVNSRLDGARMGVSPKHWEGNSEVRGVTAANMPGVGGNVDMSLMRSSYKILTVVLASRIVERYSAWGVASKDKA